MNLKLKISRYLMNYKLVDIRLSVCLSVRLSVCPSVRLSVCPSVHLSVCPSVSVPLSNHESLCK